MYEKFLNKGKISMNNFLDAIKKEHEAELSFAFTIATGTVEEAKELVLKEGAITICSSIANSDDSFESEVGNIAFNRCFDILGEELSSPIGEEELCSTL